MIRKILLAIVLLEIPLQVDRYLGHSDVEAVYGAISGFNISVTTISLLLLYAIWIPGFIRQSAFPNRSNFFVSVPLLIYVGLAAASIMTAHDRTLVCFGVFLLVQSLLLYLYIANAITTRSDVLFVLSVLMAGMCLQGALMLVTRYVTGDDIHIGFLRSEIYNASGRVCGTIGSPITAASYLGLLLPTAGGLLMTRTAPWLRYLSLAAVLLGTTGLVLTLSRGGWIGATLSGVALIFLAWRAKLISPKIPLALGALVILVGASFGPLVAERMLGDDQGSARARVPLMQIAGQMIKDHPYLGVGANNCSKVALDYAGRAAYRAEWFYTVHNKYLLVWVETGLLGLAAYVTFLFSTLRTGWRSWRTLDPVMAPIALAMTVAIAGQMCHMFVDIFNSRVQIQMLWLCAGLLVAISRLPKPQGSNLVANRESIPAPREPALAT